MLWLPLQYITVRYKTRKTKVETKGLVKESIVRYIEEISAVDENEVRLLQMGLPFDRDQGVKLLKEIYL